MASRFCYFVAVSPGLETLLLDELRHLALEGSTTPGGVECRGDMETLWTIVHRSRLAESVRLRLRPFHAAGFAELERGLERLPWHAYLKQGSAFDISVTSQGSRLYHTQAIAERVRRVIEGRWESNASSDVQPTHTKPVEQRLHVRVTSNTVQLSVGASGERLHRRGYRTHVGEAPLRETLAAATIRLLLALMPGRSPTRLWDPCCGSGTLLAEWLLLEQGSTPNALRHFAFEHWPIHDPLAYAAWLDQKSKPVASTSSCRAYGSDRNPRIISAARHNLELAGVSDRCELIAQDFREAEGRIPKSTAVVANLPYGVRLQDRASAARVFVTLDQLLARRPDLRPALVLSTLVPANQMASRWRRIAEFANGGLRVTALALDDRPSSSPRCGIVEPRADCPSKTPQ